MAEHTTINGFVKPTPPTERHAVSICSWCGSPFIHPRRAPYTACPRHRLALAMAAMGYGWQDLVARARVSEAEARAMVFGKVTP